MKKMKKTLSILISSLLACTFVTATACKEETSETDAVNGGQTQSVALNTVHIRNAEAVADKYLVSGGKSEYKIVRPAKSEPNENGAAILFQRFFGEATGVTLPIITDADVGEWTETGKYISVGKTSFLSKAGVTYDEKELTRDGYEIESKGETIFLCGGEGGILFSAYGLLEHLIHFEYFAEYCYSIDKNVTNVPFYQYDIKEIPDIDYRSWGTGAPIYSEDPFYGDGLRLSSTETPIIGQTSPWHNSFFYLPVATYYKEHSKWYSNLTNTAGEPLQLCYTAHGDGAELESMVTNIFEQMRELIIENPNRTHVTLVHEDNTSWCTCTRCADLKKKYDSNCAGYIYFLNKLSAKMDEWQYAPENEALVNGRTIKICGMVYHANEDAPVNYDVETGKCTPKDDSVICSKNVSILYAPHNTCNYYYAFDTEENKRERVNVNGWYVLADEMLCWMYNQADFSDFMSVYDNFNSMQQDYKLLARNNTVWVYDQGQWNNTNSTAWNILRVYLSSKLAWDCQIDYDKAIDRFFDNYFGIASTPMRKIFDGYRNHFAGMASRGEMQIGLRYNQPTTWPYGFMHSLDTFYDEAYEAIEALKTTDYAQYKTLYDRIRLEELSVDYTLIILYGPKWTTTELHQKQVDFINDCERLGVNKYAESNRLTIEVLAKEWKIK